MEKIFFKDATKFPCPRTWDTVTLSCSILMIDDDPFMSFLTQKFFEKKYPSIILQVVSSPIEATKLLLKEQFDVILLDIKMPIQKDGLC